MVKQKVDKIRHHSVNSKAEESVGWLMWGRGYGDGVDKSGVKSGCPL